MNKLIGKLLMGVLFVLGAMGANAQVTVTGCTGAGNGSYATLSAAATAIVAAQPAAVINITITGNTTEPVGGASLVAGTWTSLTIQPSGGNWTISGAITAGTPLLTLNGSDNVTINGLNTGGNSLTISNTTASGTSNTSTIRFAADATNNTITNCSILGSFSAAVGTNGGNIMFSTGTTTGNDNNTISNCNLGPAGANLPTKAIYGNGSTTSTAIGNSGITITNNNIFDYFGASVASAGIYIADGCNTWSITNNRFYQTATRTWTTGSTHSGININSATATQGAQAFTITGNIIGYASNTQTGVYTLTGSGTGAKFFGIRFNGITGGTVSDINSNTVAAVSMTGVTSSGTSSSSPFVAIFPENGLVNTNSNTIGSQSATGSLVFSTTTTSATDIYGLYNFSSDNWTSNSNNIGGISVTNLGASGTFILYATRAFTSTSKTWTATSNLIGGTIANSIQLNATGTSSQVLGMFTSNAGASLTSNTIRNMTTNIGTGATSSASMIGINLTSTSLNNTASQNTIFNLSNTNVSAASIVTGIQFTGSTANIVERNFIYGLTASTTSTSAEINGIRVAGGTTIFRNNMIALGAGVGNAIGSAASNSGTTGINGINEALGTNQFFHNSVYIGGNATAGTGASYAFNGTQTTNTRSFRDNIFYNARTNSGATGKHYAVKINGTAANPAGLTINNNVYFANGSGGVFGFFNSLDVASLSAWKTAVGQDAGSFESNPQYNDPTNATPDLHLHPTNPTIAEANGSDVGVTNDYDGQTRASLTPVDIGADAGNFTAPAVMTYVSSTTTQTNTSSVNTNSTNQQVIGIEVVTTGSTSPLSATSFTINTNGTTSAADIANAKIFYTGTSSTFAATSQFGSAVAAPSGSHVISGTQTLLEGTNYFWVTYDVLCTATPSNVIDAECNSLTVGVAQTPTVQAPAGSRTIVTGPLSGTKTVGTSGDYANLTAAIAAINSVGLGGNLTLSILNNLTEAAGVVISPWAECGGSNFTLTIKPAASTTPTISASSSTATILLDGADRVTIDGSNNGSTSRDMTIANTNTGSSNAVVWGRNGALNNTFKNLVIQGNSNTTTFVGLGFGGSTIATTGNSSSANNSNTIQNNNIRACQHGIISNGVSTATRNTGTVISQNILNNTGANALGVAGILVRNDNGAIISQNLIGNISSSSTAWGINLGATAFNTYSPGTVDEVINASITKNTIATITHTGTSSCFGIILAPATTGTAQISNNSIAAINGGATPSDITSGIFVGGGNGSTTQVYFNSVYMSGGGTLGRTTPSVALAIGNSTNNPIVNVRNNVLVNTSTSSSGASAATGAYAFSTTSTTHTNLTFNYNDLFVSGTHGILAGTGTMPSLTAQSTLAALNTAITGGANSIQADPLFNTTTNLAPGVGSPVENAGDNSTGVTDDINSVVRDATPYMGAYENSLDAVGPTITYTPIGQTCNTSGETLTASISDPSGVPTSGAGLPVLYWRINAGSWNAATGTYVSGSNYSFTFGSGVVATNVVQYYIVAQDSYSTPNVSAFPSAGAGGFTINPPAASTPPTTPSSYTIGSTLNGTYTVGSGGNYATLTAAVAAYNGGCVTGPVTFSLTDATYTGETFPITINANTGASSTNTLTIKPTGTSAISGSAASSLIILNGADYVTIDGSSSATANTVCPLSAASRNLTLTNTATNSTSDVIWLSSNGTDGATNNKIINCIIAGNGGPAAATFAGIFSGGAAGGAATAVQSNNQFINNNISKCYYGIFTYGVSAASKNTGTIINQNVMTAASPNQIGRGGIISFYEDGITISGNNIGNISGVSSNYAWGISLGLASITTTNSTGADVTNATVTKNFIGSIRAASTYGVGGIQVAPVTSGTTLIANNMISDAFTNGTAGDIGAGIYIGGAAGSITQVYHNTITMAGSLSGGSYSNFGIAVNGTNPTVDIRNNIFTNTGSNGYNGNRAMGFAYSTFSNLTSDNNDLFASGTSSGVVQTGTLSNSGFTNYTAVTGAGSWSLASTKDLNSKNFLPTFISATDLHINSLVLLNVVNLNGTGSLTTGITDDIDCESRSPLPDIGADQFSTSGYWTGTTSTDWGTSTNWADNVVPSSGDNITVLSGVTNNPLLDVNRTIGAISLGTGTTVGINGQTFTINGGVSGVGTISGSSASNLTLNGTAGTLNFTSGSRSLNNLSLGATGVAALGTALDIYGTVGFTAGGSLNMNAQAVTLKSNATNTARIADLTGSTLTGASNVTMERYIKLRSGGTGRAYRLLAPTVNTIGHATKPSIKDNWMEGGMVSTVGGSSDPVPNFGTHITGAGGNTNGFDVTASNAPSLYSTANGVTPTYTAIGSTGGNLDAKTGYFMYVRGNRAESLTIPLAAGMPTSATTLRTTGTLVQGTQTTFANAYTGGGAWNLVTNPYPSPIDWSLVQPASSGITGSYIYWDPNIGSRGGFAAVTTGGVSTPATSATQIIQSGQAFFVESDNIAPTPSVSIQESHKVAGNNNDVFLVPPPPVESFRTELYFTEPNGYRRIADGAIALYDNSYSKALDTKDTKEINNWDENIAISRDGKHLAIEARPVIGKSDDLPIFMNNMKKQGYEFEFTPLVFTNTNLKAELVDNFLGTRTLLSVVNPTVVSFNITDDPASKATDRFKVVFGEFGNPTGVDVITIKASQQNNGVQVDWTSKTETDMLRYEVEKSTYGTTFAKVNSTAAIGNSTTPVDYNWFDTNPNMGTNFYRIKGIDKAGNTRYSEIVRVLFGKGEPSIVVYPNPLQGTTFKIDMYNLVKGTYVLNLYNSMGQLVYTEQLQHDGSQATKTINLKGDIGKGSFQLQLSGDGFKTTKQIIKN